MLCHLLDRSRKSATIGVIDCIPMNAKRLLLFAAALLATTLSSCNTMAGIGEDISRGGRALSSAAS